jgi:hypothetical protein
MLPGLDPVKVGRQLTIDPDEERVRAAATFGKAGPADWVLEGSRTVAGAPAHPRGLELVAREPADRRASLEQVAPLQDLEQVSTDRLPFAQRQGRARAEHPPQVLTEATARRQPQCIGEVLCPLPCRPDVERGRPLEPLLFIEGPRGHKVLLTVLLDLLERVGPQHVHVNRESAPHEVQERASDLLSSLARGIHERPVAVLPEGRSVADGFQVLVAKLQEPALLEVG